MRVLFLTFRDGSHPLSGGNARYIEEIATRLAADGHRVSVFAARPPGASAREERQGVRFIRRGGWWSVYLWAALYHVTGRLGGHDIVVDVENGVPFCSPLYCRRPVVLLVHHVHRRQWDMSFPKPVARFGWWVESKVAPRLYRGRVHVAVSEATKRDLSTLGVSAGEVRVVRNGVRPVAAQSASTIRAAGPTIVSLGRLAPHKRLDLLLRAAARLRRDIPDLRVVVMGTGKEESRLRREAAQLSLSDRVTFTGRVSDEERDRLLREAWVLGIPSVNEGWGMAAVEAAAIGTPAVGFRVGGLTESIVDGQTGLLVDDEDGFVEALRTVLTDTSLRDRLGEAAARTVRAYSWDRAASEFTEVLREAVSGRQDGVSPPPG